MEKTTRRRDEGSFGGESRIQAIPSVLEEGWTWSDHLPGRLRPRSITPTPRRLSFLRTINQLIGYHVLIYCFLLSINDCRFHIRCCHRIDIHSPFHEPAFLCGVYNLPFSGNKKYYPLLVQPGSNVPTGFDRNLQFAKWLSIVQCLPNARKIGRAHV